MNESKPLSPSKVALIPCGSYDVDVTLQAVRKGLELLGGIEQFLQPGESILLKPNVLVGSNPDKCVCTHPSVLRAVAIVFKEAGAVLSCGDSPAAGGCAINMRLSGLKQVIDELDVPLADFGHGTDVTHPSPLLYRHFTIADSVLAADGLVSIPKLKAHPLTSLTGAIKNQYGCIPGMLKAQQHARIPNAYDFGKMLVDLNTFIKPRLYVMDAVMAMEGNGPRGGNPRKLGVILVSSDPVALDAVACRLIDLDPAFVPTSAPGEEAGLGTWHFENIEILGAEIQDFICREFDAVRKPPDRLTGGWKGRFIKRHASPRPVINEEKCSRCGTCIHHCPVEPKAVDWQDNEHKKVPDYEYTHCIRCFCCQEICPEGAITVSTPLLGRIVFRS